MSVHEPSNASDPSALVIVSSETLMGVKNENGPEASLVKRELGFNV